MAPQRITGRPQHNSQDRLLTGFTIAGIGAALLAAGLIAYIGVISPLEEKGIDWRKELLKKFSSQPSTNSLQYIHSETNLLNLHLQPYNPK